MLDSQFGGLWLRAGSCFRGVESTEIKGGIPKNGFGVCSVYVLLVSFFVIVLYFFCGIPPRNCPEGLLHAASRYELSHLRYYNE